jgi:hypothetical protein
VGRRREGKGEGREQARSIEGKEKGGYRKERKERTERERK